LVRRPFTTASRIASTMKASVRVRKPIFSPVRATAGSAFATGTSSASRQSSP
jgi:hypothetical protein